MQYHLKRIARLASQNISVGLCFSIGLLLVLGVKGESSWPRFRGPGGSGIGAGDFPTHFGVSSNVVWNTSVPLGHSSPCIWGRRLFLTGFADNRLLTFCLDRRSGMELWRGHLPAGKIERGARLGNPATATPVTDGRRLYVYFGAFGLACYELDGREVWRKSLPVPVTQHGAGTSPVLAGDLLILNCDQDVDSYLLAVNKRTGKTLWRTDRPAFRRGFSTPLPYPAENPVQLVVPGTLRLVSYNLSDGEERWYVRGLPNELVSSPTAGDGLVFVAGWTSGPGVRRMPAFSDLLAEGDEDSDGRLTRKEAPAGPAKQHFVYIDANKDGSVTREEYESLLKIFAESKNVAMAVRPDGKGDVTETHIVWEARRGLPYVPSPLVYDGRLFLVRNGGLASCFDAKTGKAYYQQERLGALGDYYASPVAAAGKICVASRQGTVVICRAADSLDVLARNKLGESILATPAIVDGVLYIRTIRRIYAFSEVKGSGAE